MNGFLFDRSWQSTAQYLKRLKEPNGVALDNVGALTLFFLSFILPSSFLLLFVCVCVFFFF